MSGAAETREVTVPDIGDFDEVDVVEVLVEPGSRVEREQGLVVLESEKASMEIPAPGGSPGPGEITTPSGGGEVAPDAPPAPASSASGVVASFRTTSTRAPSSPRAAAPPLE